MRRKRKKREITGKLSLIMALVVLAVLVAISIAWSLTQRGNGGASQQKVEEPFEPMNTENFGLGSTIDLVTRALSVESPHKLSRFFHLNGLDETEAFNYLQSLNIPSREQLRFTSLSKDQGSRGYDGVVLEWRDGIKTKSRTVAVTRNGEGELKVDYDAFAHRCEPAWNVMVREQKGGKARVILSKDNYYNGQYQEEDWLCYRLRNLGSEQYIYGYVRKDTPQDNALEEITRSINTHSVRKDRNGNPIFYAYLKIEKQGGSLDRQYKISRVLAGDWVMTNTALDETF